MAVEEGTVTQRVVEALAEAEGVDPLELDVSLYEAIDADALEALARRTGTEWRLQFVVVGRVVTVPGGEDVTVDVL